VKVSARYHPYELLLFAAVLLTVPFWVPVALALEDPSGDAQQQPPVSDPTADASNPMLKTIFDTTTEGVQKTIDFTTKGVKSSISLGKKGVKQGLEWSSEAIKKAGLEQDVEAVRKTIEQATMEVIKRRTFIVGDHPFTVQGVPIVYQWDERLFYGFRVHLYDVKDRKPYTFGTTLQLIEDDLRGRNHNATFDYPSVFGEFRLKLHGTWLDEPQRVFFEPGNTSSFVLSNLKDHWYGMRKAVYGAGLGIELFDSHHHLYTGFMGQELRIYDLGQLISLRQPLGLEGGRSNLLLFGYNFDSRDNEFMTKAGAYDAVVLSWHTGLVGSDYEFQRVHLFDARFHATSKSVVVANKVVFDWIFGNSPFFEESEFGGLSQFSGVGGAKSVRGLPTGRFADKVKVVDQFEVRIDSGTFHIRKHEFRVWSLPFLDLGRVWSDRPFSDLSDLHLSLGLGFRLVWNDRFIIRFDNAFAETGFAANGGFGSTF